MSIGPLSLEAQFSGVANMSNGEFQEKYVHFYIVPNSGKTVQWIVSKPLVHKIAPHYIMTTPHETGLTAPPNERHIPVYSQELSLLSRQEHTQHSYNSHVNPYQYPSSSVMPNQECPQPHITSTPGQTPYLQQIQQQHSLQQSKDSTQNDVVTQHLHQQMLNQSQLNDTLGWILNNQQSLQRETISMMNEMSMRHENEQFIHDILMFNERT